MQAWASYAVGEDSEDYEGKDYVKVVSLEKEGEGTEDHPGDRCGDEQQET
jgi:hypothetical protein